MLDWSSESAKDVNTFKIIVSALEWAQVNLGSNTHWNSLQVQFMDLRYIVLHCMVANICSVAVNSISFTPKVTFLIKQVVNSRTRRTNPQGPLSLSVLKRLNVRTQSMTKVETRRTLIALKVWVRNSCFWWIRLPKICVEYAITFWRWHYLH
jgi:hypothetical protein